MTKVVTFPPVRIERELLGDVPARVSIEIATPRYQRLCRLAERWNLTVEQTVGVLLIEALDKQVRLHDLD